MGHNLHSQVGFARDGGIDVLMAASGYASTSKCAQPFTRFWLGSIGATSRHDGSVLRKRSDSSAEAIESRGKRHVRARGS